jgi:hypothetical protein
VDALLIAKVLVAGGFAAWFLVNVLNHLSDWKGTLHFVSGFMAMSSLEEEPRIPTPLTSRRIVGGPLPTLVLVIITATQAAIGLAYAAATILLAAVDVRLGTDVALLASAGAGTLWLIFLIAGAWFAYWLKLGDLQRTHILLLGASMLGILVFRL